MKRFMVVYSIPGDVSFEGDPIPGKTCAAFFDHVAEAEQFRMDCECGMGGYAEVYERQEPSVDNDYMGGYVLLYC